KRKRSYPKSSKTHGNGPTSGLAERPRAPRERCERQLPHAFVSAACRRGAIPPSMARRHISLRTIGLHATSSPGRSGDCRIRKGGFVMKKIKKALVGAVAATAVVGIAFAYPSEGDVAYNGSTFSSVWAQVASDPYSSLPHDRVTFGSFYGFLE